MSLLTDSADMPTLHTWNTSILWCTEAIKWLLARIDDKGDVKP